MKAKWKLSPAALLLWSLQAQPARQDVRTNVVTPPAPAQPLPYSHKLHVAQGLQCRMCHTNPAPGSRLTCPATSPCMSCQATIAKDRPAILKLAECSRSRQPIPWVRVYQLTPGVSWSHRKHPDAGMQCVMCHGEVGRLDTMAETT